MNLAPQVYQVMENTSYLHPDKLEIKLQLYQI
jgi:hypothetical protein